MYSTTISASIEWTETRAETNSRLGCILAETRRQQSDTVFCVALNQDETLSPAFAKQNSCKILQILSEPVLQVSVMSIDLKAFRAKVKELRQVSDCGCTSAKNESSCCSCPTNLFLIHFLSISVLSAKSKPQPPSSYLKLWHLSFLTDRQIEKVCSSLLDPHLATDLLR